MADKRHGDLLFIALVIDHVFPDKRPLLLTQSKVRAQKLVLAHVRPGESSAVSFLSHQSDNFISNLLCCVWSCQHQRILAHSLQPLCIAQQLFDFV